MIIVYALFAIPLIYMELFLGQYSKLNCLSFGKITPIAFGKYGVITVILLFLVKDNSSDLK